MRPGGMARYLIAVTSIILGVCLLAYWFNSTNNPRYIARKCERRVRASVDPMVLQSWATNLLASYPIGRTNYTGPFQAPAYLRGVWAKKVPGVYIQGGYFDEQAHHRVFWGAGGMGQWGLLVGAADFVPTSQEHGEREWRPGIYFFQDFR